MRSNGHHGNRIYNRANPPYWSAPNHAACQQLSSRLLIPRISRVFTTVADSVSFQNDIVEPAGTVVIRASAVPAMAGVGPSGSAVDEFADRVEFRASG